MGVAALLCAMLAFVPVLLHLWRRYYRANRQVGNKCDENVLGKTDLTSGRLKPAGSSMGLFSQRRS
jgi:hypothetical protein